LNVCRLLVTSRERRGDLPEYRPSRRLRAPLAVRFSCRLAGHRDHRLCGAVATACACLLVDDDPQGSLTLWNELREIDALPIKTVKRGITDILKKAKRDGVEWVFIDTPPNVSVSVIEAIEAATLVIIPCRPGLFDINAVQETIGYARQARTPYAVVLNAAPPKRHDVEAAAVTAARECLGRLQVPVWGGQITHRANFSLALTEGEGVKEYDIDSYSTAEIGRLWLAIEKSVKAIHGARDGAAMHRVAA
jgi:chromosome partitioning protein